MSAFPNHLAAVFFVLCLLMPALGDEKPDSTPTVVSTADSKALKAPQEEAVEWDFGANSLSCCEKLGFSQEQNIEVVRVMRRHSTKIKGLCNELRTVLHEKPENDEARKHLNDRVDAIKKELAEVQLMMRTDLRRIATVEQREKWDKLERAKKLAAKS